jgi:hypothetical protein
MSPAPKLRASTRRSQGWILSAIEPLDGMKQKKVKSEPCNKWDPAVWAFCGAMIGMSLGIAVQASDIIAGRFDDSNPFIQIATEMAVFAFGGAMLLAAVARMRNRSGRKSFRTNRRR